MRRVVQRYMYQGASARFWPDSFFVSATAVSSMLMDFLWLDYAISGT